MRCEKQFIGFKYSIIKIKELNQPLMLKQLFQKYRLKEVTLIFILLSAFFSSCIILTKTVHVSSLARIKGVQNCKNLVQIDKDSIWCFIVDKNEFFSYSNLIKDSILHLNVNPNKNDTIRVNLNELDENIKEKVWNYIYLKIKEHRSIVVLNKKSGRKKSLMWYKYFDEQPSPRLGGAGFEYYIKGAEIHCIDYFIRRY